MKRQQKNFKCIIFDCDNVLVDTETTFISVLMDMAGSYGAEMEADEAISLFSGRKIADTIAILEERYGLSFPADFEQSFRARVYEEFKKGVLPMEGVEDLLASLDLPFCVASSGPREKINLNLALTSLDRYFQDERIFSCYDIQSWKPEPDIFIHAAKCMGFTPPQCVVIEDSIAGVKAATAGGFVVYGLTNGHNREELEKEGAIVFDHMSDLAEILGIRQ